LFKRIKILTLLLLGLAIFAGAAAAVWPAPQAGTMPFYWVKGTVNDPSGQLAGRPVILYATTFDSTKVVTAEVGTGGVFYFNAYDLFFYHKDDNYMEIGGKPVFNVAVVRDWGGVTNNYGSSEICTVDWSKGYITTGLTLINGGGPQAGKGQIAGIVTDEVGAVVAGATIIANTGASDTSDTSGAYLLDNFDPGSYALACSKASYGTVNKTAAVTANNVTWVGFRLSVGGNADTGKVRKTWIERMTNGNVILHWDYDTPAGYTIHIYAKDGGPFSTNPDDYSVNLGSEVAGVTSKLITDAAVPIRYYRVVTTSDPALRMADSENSITAVKYTWDLAKGFNLVGVPFYPTTPSGSPDNNHIDGSIPNIVGAQLPNESIIQSWKTTDFNPNNWMLDPASYNDTAGGWGTPPFEITLGKGLWVYRPLTDGTGADPRALRMVGVVKNTDFSSQIRGSFNLIAAPYPINYIVDNFGLGTGPTDEDVIQKWDGIGLIPVSKIDPAWADTPIEIGKGYWYYHKLDADPIDWNAPRP